MYLITLLLLQLAWLAKSGPILSIKGTLAARRIDPAVPGSAHSGQIGVPVDEFQQNPKNIFSGQSAAPVSVTQSTFIVPGRNDPEPNIGQGSHGSQDSLDHNWSQAPFVAERPNSHDIGGNGNRRGSNYGTGTRGFRRGNGYHSSYRSGYHSSYGSYGTHGYSGSFSRQGFSSALDPYDQYNPQESFGHGFDYYSDALNPKSRSKRSGQLLDGITQESFGKGFDYYSDTLKPKSRSKRSGPLLDGIIQGIKEDLFQNEQIIGVPGREDRQHRTNNPDNIHSNSDSLLKGIFSGIRKDIFPQPTVARNPIAPNPNFNNRLPQRPPVTTVIQPTSSAPVVGTRRNENDVNRVIINRVPQRPQQSSTQVVTHLIRPTSGTSAIGTQRNQNVINTFFSNSQRQQQQRRQQNGFQIVIPGFRNGFNDPRTVVQEIQNEVNHFLNNIIPNQAQQNNFPAVIPVFQPSSNVQRAGTQGNRNGINPFNDSQQNNFPAIPVFQPGSNSPRAGTQGNQNGENPFFNNRLPNQSQQNSNRLNPTFPNRHPQPPRTVATTVSSPTSISPNVGTPRK